MGSRLSNPKIQYSDDAGNPLPEGKLYFYDSGTTNFRVTYADSGLSIANSNPVVLDGAGRVPSIFLEGNYRVILTDKDDNQVWELDPVTGTSGSAQFSGWLITTTYVLNDIVRGSDGKYYISITNSNLGNNPTSSDANWSEMVFITTWNENQTYLTDEIVAYSGALYTSLVDSNTGNQPDLSASEWTQTAGSASDISYDDSVSGWSTVSNAQDALDQLYAKVGRKNLIINGNLNTTIINQEGFAGGQPAAGVYGYDMWKGDTLGTRIEQIVENSEAINETYTISWVGGTGTADVEVVTGLNSGDSFTLNTGGNFSVIVPTDATYVQVERGSVATDFEYRTEGEELALCQRYFWQGEFPSSLAYSYAAAGSGNVKSSGVDFPVTMRANPILAIVTAPTYENCTADSLVGTAGGMTERVDVIATAIYRASRGVYSANARL